MSLGKKILRLRQRKRFSQRELAQRVGIDQAIISRLEQGKQHQVRSDVLRQFAEVLGCTTDYLVGVHGQGDGEESQHGPARRALVGA